MEVTGSWIWVRRCYKNQLGGLDAEFRVEGGEQYCVLVAGHNSYGHD
jgi:hypothetical protein